MRPETSTVRLTYQDLQAIPDDGKRRELVDGELHVAPAPNTRHQRLVGRLLVAIGRHLEAHADGEVLTAPFDVVFSEMDVVQPDLLFLSAEHASRLTDRNLEGAPDLVIEVSESTRRHDERVKRRLYERSGVAEYWTVDPELDSVKVYRRSTEGLPLEAELSAEADDTLSTPLLPGLAIRLPELFA